ncbi:hypothetical protein [Natrinema soli]|uniref:Uncharacterized protein n=1 Tax=Natrinema soli TaxID=1930624 RepID=A0ABD5SH59_9EURY|nr:hypothetical protein [Natrinema soli]
MHEKSIYLTSDNLERNPNVAQIGMLDAADVTLISLGSRSVSGGFLCVINR